MIEPVNSTQLCRVCQERLGWKKPTTYTVLRKLGERGLLRNENATVTALVGREEVRQYESQAVVQRGLSSLFGTEKAHPKGGGGAEKTY